MELSHWNCLSLGYGRESDELDFFCSKRTHPVCCMRIEEHKSITVGIVV